MIRSFKDFADGWYFYKLVKYFNTTETLIWTASVDKRYEIVSQRLKGKI